MASPLKQIQVIPLASESFGVRSMCTLVKTPDVIILLDAGVSLCPWRFNLPPHPLEFQAIKALREEIAIAADKSQIITLSHYHYDHHTPVFEDWIVNWTSQRETARQIYENKTVLIKNPEDNIKGSQQKRAVTFLKTSAKCAKSVQKADGNVFSYGNTVIYCSKAVPHGEDNSSMGYVVMTTIEYEQERFMFAPDVQGPIVEYTKQEILKTQPALIMLGGPPFYLTGFKVKEVSLQNAVSNLGAIVEAVPITILEHHTLRDQFSKQNLALVQSRADQFGHKLLTAAEFTGHRNNFLEANRENLYQMFPPSEKFQLWMKTLNNKVICKPPM
ncbi:MAG: hypothetical protein LBH62_07055 [Nitrososphaerota archaeon]|jgi:predicted metallo-beta-lactamase superfamily hydrolase|nr:hypothetical protein [Nitrososphaerota archaeon]